MTDPPDWAGWRSRFLLFTGKGGVGKTTAAAASAVALADRGRRVLLVSTDPASNLDEVLGTVIGDEPTAVDGAAGLFAMNIDPEAAATAYREGVLGPLRGVVPDDELEGVREQLSGQCTVEVAAFDEFSRLLGDPSDTADFDHVIFDTAPTGHTLRLLSLPAAWSDYIDTNPGGASCLGPLASLQSKRRLYEATVEALGDPTSTTVVLVSRADRSSLREAARAGGELALLGVENQRLVVNGLLVAPLDGDAVALAFAERQVRALADMPESLRGLSRSDIPLMASDLCGVDQLRNLVSGRSDPPSPESEAATTEGFGKLDDLIAELAAPGNGVVMVMGKGGVGKTTVAVAVALGLCRLGHHVHLATTDPAGRFDDFVGATVPEGLTVSRIDPAEEVRRYTADKLRTASGLDAEQRALMEEDLRSPCTEEIAVFGAFSRLLREGRTGFVVIDTAPSGHTLLLIDRTGAYHRETMRRSAGVQGRVTTPLMWLQDPDRTRVLLVALPEATPVQEAAELQQDLRRAGVSPYAWVVNASLAASGTGDPLLRRRAALEGPHLARVRDELAARAYLVPWSPDPANYDLVPYPAAASTPTVEP